MPGLLEVIALNDVDAARAEEGGADRIELLSTMDDDGLSPTPAAMERARKATSIQIRPMVRLRAGFGTDGGEFGRLKGLIAAYLSAGADGFVFGFMTGLGLVDEELIRELVGDGLWPWTFHRAIDHTFETERAWRSVPRLPRVDQILSAGSARGVDEGLDSLIARASSNPKLKALIMAGGGLRPDHVPWLARAGIRAFHIGSPARALTSFDEPVDPDAVRGWRDLIDTEVRRANQRS